MKHLGGCPTHSTCTICEDGKLRSLGQRRRSKITASDLAQPNISFVGRCSVYVAAVRGPAAGLRAAVNINRLGERAVIRRTTLDA